MGRASASANQRQACHGLGQSASSSDATHQWRADVVARGDEQAVVDAGDGAAAQSLATDAVDRGLQEAEGLVVDLRDRVVGQLWATPRTALQPTSNRPHQPLANQEACSESSALIGRRPMCSRDSGQGVCAGP